MSKIKKFRAWHVANKMMIPHENLSVSVKNIKDDNIWKFMEYTTMNDIDDVEIYEDDYVTFETGLAYRVVWINDGWMGYNNFAGMQWMSLVNPDNAKKLKVVGHIYSKEAV